MDGARTQRDGSRIWVDGTVEGLVAELHGVADGGGGAVAGAADVEDLAGARVGEDAAEHGVGSGQDFSGQRGWDRAVSGELSGVLVQAEGDRAGLRSVA